jgi:DHA2 family multidrug resistance protein-like MFS transporter
MVEARGGAPARGHQVRATRPGPERPGLVLAALILVAAVANLNLAVANVALPDIGRAFDASQTELNLVVVGYSLGLAASVLYLGAVGDRYGRKLPTKPMAMRPGSSSGAGSSSGWAPRPGRSDPTTSS